MACSSPSLIGSKPRLQKTGDTFQELNLTFRLHAKFCNPAQELATLGNAKTDGEILPLLLGDGTYVSGCVIYLRPLYRRACPCGRYNCSGNGKLALKEYLPYSKEDNRSNQRAVTFATEEKKLVFIAIKT